MEGLVQESIVKAIVKAIPWSPPAIARFHFPVVAFGFSGPRTVGPGEVVDGDGHPIPFAWLGYRGLLRCRRGHPWANQAAARQKTEGVSTDHRCIVDQLASLTHKAIVR